MSKIQNDLKLLVFVVLLSFNLTIGIHVLFVWKLVVYPFSHDWRLIWFIRDFNFFCIQVINNSLRSSVISWQFSWLGNTLPFGWFDINLRRKIICQWLIADVFESDIPFQVVLLQFVLVGPIQMKHTLYLSVIIFISNSFNLVNQFNVYFTLVFILMAGLNHLYWNSVDDRVVVMNVF